MRKKVCAAVIRRNGLTLICSRPKATIHGDKMEFPGGKVEPGESLNECIVRELKEELNAEVLPLDVIHEIEHPYPSGVLNGFSLSLFFRLLSSIFIVLLFFILLLTLVGDKGLNIFC